DLDFVTRLSLSFSVPCLIFATLVKAEITSGAVAEPRPAATGRLRRRVRGAELVATAGEGEGRGEGPGREDSGREESGREESGRKESGREAAGAGG
ncbi:MAG: hypothetical protein AAF725_21410, partial [Acidobacteriota bacterium]